MEAQKPMTRPRDWSVSESTPISMILEVRRVSGMRGTQRVLPTLAAIWRRTLVAMDWNYLRCRVGSVTIWEITLSYNRQSFLMAL
jgi:hypothetical protein